MKVILLNKCISITTDNSFVADCMIQKEKVMKGVQMPFKRLLRWYETSLPACLAFPDSCLRKTEQKMKGTVNYKKLLGSTWRALALWLTWC